MKETTQTTAIVPLRPNVTAGTHTRADSTACGEVLCREHAIRNRRHALEASLTNGSASRPITDVTARPVHHRPI